MVSFKVTNKESKIIDAITDRIMEVCKRQGVHDYLWLDANMDITATHANGNRLDLQGLLEADDFNFTHDVAGIRRHLNRETGKLENCFVPRFTVKEKGHGTHQT